MMIIYEMIQPLSEVSFKLRQLLVLFFQIDVDAERIGSLGSLIHSLGIHSGKNEQSNTIELALSLLSQRSISLIKSSEKISEQRMITQYFLTVTFEKWSMYS